MDNARLIKAHYIDHGWTPTTPASHALTASILATVLPHLQAARTRPIGPKALPSLTKDLGGVLAGIMRPGGAPVRAARGKASPMWSTTESIGYDRFWSIVDALKTAGLAGERKGIKGASHGIVGAYASALWPLQALIDRAEDFCVAPSTRKTDWGPDPDVVAAPARRPLGVIVSPWQGVNMGMSGDMEREMERMREELATLNGLNASVAIRGAGASVTLHRKFRHSLAFGGRFWTPTYQNLSDAERLRITIDGEPVASVDVKASQLTVLHGLTGCVGPGHSLPRRDLYALDGLPRDAVKAWTTRTLGRGTVKWGRLRWDADDSPEVWATPIKAVRDAMLGLYPFLQDIEALVPPSMMASVPPERRAKAAGQYVTAREAEALAGALSYCVSRGVPVLPVHDALLVPASKVQIATEGLEGAYVALLGVAPVLEVAQGP